jgi:hypothetical protein
MIVIDLSTPEKFRKFEESYVKALGQHLKDQAKPFDLAAVAEEAGVVEPPKPEVKD